MAQRWARNVFLRAGMPAYVGGLRGGSGRGGGRGWYYKQLYGGGGRKRRELEQEQAQQQHATSTRHQQPHGRPPPPEAETEVHGSGPGCGKRAPTSASSSPSFTEQQAQLRRTLLAMDGRSYGTYKDIIGSYDFGSCTLFVDHVQSDPFAPPSNFRARIPHAVALFPLEAYSPGIRAVALGDYLARAFHRSLHEHRYHVHQASGGWGGSKGGEMHIDQPSQHVLPRTAVIVSSSHIEVRFTVSLPARGRSIMGPWAATIVTENIPRVIRNTMFFDMMDAKHLFHHVLSVEDQEALRQKLRSASLLAFVRNGAILPRKSGATDAPMDTSDAVPFQSPPSLEREFDLPNSGKIRGMGIPLGITLIVGGGFHGKSTLLEALQFGIYNKVPGDGREFVSTDPDAVSIRAEDGRSVENLDISPFINNLPGGKSTLSFSTADASGSTSQAANIMEALELGCSGLLIDEDKTATNFMIRDRRMQMLVAKDHEPITPFIYKIRSLFLERGVSTVLIIGGAGDYFDVADTVVMMQAYVPFEVTERAKEIAQMMPTGQVNEGGECFGEVKPRCPVGRSLERSFASHDRQKVKAGSKSSIMFGDTEIDLSAVEQIAERSQTNCIADALMFLKRLRIDGLAMDGRHSMCSLLQFLEQRFDSPQGLDEINEIRMHRGDYARPRRFEIAAALNRLRTISMVQCSQEKEQW